jgi:uncharacterized membrane protein
MESGGVVQGIEVIARGLEIFGILVIVFSFLHAIIRCLLQFGRKITGAYERLRIYMGKALQLSLEFLIAADIIRTVTIEPTMSGLLSLGVLILVRTVLSWSITVEIEGCWPWEVSKMRKG